MPQTLANDARTLHARAEALQVHRFRYQAGVSAGRGHRQHLVESVRRYELPVRSRQTAQNPIHVREEHQIAAQRIRSDNDGQRSTGRPEHIRGGDDRRPGVRQVQGAVGGRFGWVRESDSGERGLQGLFAVAGR